MLPSLYGASANSRDYRWNITRIRQTFGKKSFRARSKKTFWRCSLTKIFLRQTFITKPIKKALIMKRTTIQIFFCTVPSVTNQNLILSVLRVGATLGHSLIILSKANGRSMIYAPCIRNTNSFLISSIEVPFALTRRCIKSQAF